MKRVFVILGIAIVMAIPSWMNAQEIALLKYRGGGDWYANPTSLTNLIRFCNQQLGTNLKPAYATVEVGSPDIYRFPFIHMTGHGNVIFSDDEAANLRNYLMSGGFLHIDDNYGLKQSAVFCILMITTD